MKIKKITASNILSLGNINVDFPDSGLVLIEGWNFDAQRANGAGKTAIFNAICFALYDKMPIKITASEILRRGAEKGFASVEVELGEDVLKITRTRPKGLVVELNDSVINVTQLELESKLRLNYDQFLLSMYFCQGSIGRFLFLGDADKKTFLLQVLGLDRFAVCKKETDDQIKAILSTIESAKNALTSDAARIEAYSENLIDEGDVRQAIDDIAKQISEANESISVLRSVPSPDLKKINDLERGLELKKHEITSAKIKRSMLHDQFKKISSKLREFTGQEQCELCGSSLDISSAREHHDNEMLSINNEKLSLKEEIDACDIICQKEGTLLQTISKLKEKKLQQTAAKDAADKRVSELSSFISLRQQELNNRRLKLENNKILLNKINILEDSVSKHQSAISVNNRNLEFYKAISSAFSPTGIQAYVLDSIIELFNIKVQDYLNLIWPTASYRLLSFKETSKGTIVAKLSDQLTMNGESVSLGSLSGGELRALSICSDLTILDILEQHLGLPLNPVIMDEPFDGLDSVGRELVIELLENIFRTRSVMIVDHSSEAKTMFSKVIRVEKRSGVSNVIVDI